MVSLFFLVFIVLFYDEIDPPPSRAQSPMGAFPSIPADG